MQLPQKWPSQSQIHSHMLRGQLTLTRPLTEQPQSVLCPNAAAEDCGSSCNIHAAPANELGTTQQRVERRERKMTPSGATVKTRVVAVWKAWNLQTITPQFTNQINKSGRHRDNETAESSAAHAQLWGESTHQSAVQIIANQSNARTMKQPEISNQAKDVTSSMNQPRLQQSNK